MFMVVLRITYLIGLPFSLSIPYRLKRISNTMVIDSVTIITYYQRPKYENFGPMIHLRTPFDVLLFLLARVVHKEYKV